MIPSLALPNTVDAIDHEMKFHSQNASFTLFFYSGNNRLVALREGNSSDVSLKGTFFDY